MKQQATRTNNERQQTFVSHNQATTEVAPEYEEHSFEQSGVAKFDPMSLFGGAPADTEADSSDADDHFDSENNSSSIVANQTQMLPNGVPCTECEDSIDAGVSYDSEGESTLSNPTALLDLADDDPPPCGDKKRQRKYNRARKKRERQKEKKKKNKKRKNEKEDKALQKQLAKMTPAERQAYDAEVKKEQQEEAEEERKAAADRAAMLKRRQGLVDDRGKQITSSTFEGQKDYEGPNNNSNRRGVEFESVMELVCEDSGEVLDPTVLYRFLARDDWDHFEDMAKSRSSAAYAGLEAYDDMPWRDEYHKIREQNKYVWISVENGSRIATDQQGQTIRGDDRYHSEETDMDERVESQTTTVDDYYLDTKDFTLTNEDIAYRARVIHDILKIDDDNLERYPEYEMGDEIEAVRRILIQIKYPTPKDEKTYDDDGAVKARTKEDIRRGDWLLKGDHLDHFETLLADAISGTVRWNDIDGPPESIAFVRKLFADLEKKGLLPEQPSDTPDSQPALELAPQAFLRSRRARHHYDELRYQDIAVFHRNADGFLKQVSEKAQQELRTFQMDMHKTEMASIAEKLPSMIDDLGKGSAVVERVNALLKENSPGVQTTAGEIDTLYWKLENQLPEVGEELTGAEQVTSALEVEKMHYIAQAISEQYHAVAATLRKRADGNREAWWQLFPRGGQNQLRAYVNKIDAAGSSLLGYWFSIAKTYATGSDQVPDNPRDNLYIDTFDATSAFTPEVWAEDPAMSDRSGFSRIKGKESYHTMVRNEVQMELEREQPFLTAIKTLRTDSNAYKDMIDGTNAEMQAKQEADLKLKHAEFILTQYHDAANQITQERGTYVISRLENEIRQAEKRGEKNIPCCKKWGWKKAEKSKGQEALDRSPNNPKK